MQHPRRAPFTYQPHRIAEENRSLPYQSSAVTSCVEPNCTSDIIKQFNHALGIDEDNADTGLLASDDVDNRENSVGVVEETDNSTQINIQYNDEIISK
jgi:hypothetical protein